MRVFRILCVIAMAVRLHAADAGTYEPLKRASVLFDEGKKSEASSVLRESVERFAAEGDRHGEGVALFMLAIAEESEATLRRSYALLPSTRRWRRAKPGECPGYGDGGRPPREDRSPIGTVRRIHRASRRTLAWIGERHSAPFSNDQVLPFFAVFDAPPEFREAPPAKIKAMVLWVAEKYVRQSLGETLLTAGRLTEAETELQRARELAALLAKPADREVASLFGDLRRRQNRVEDARTAYIEALEAKDASPLSDGTDDDLELLLRKLSAVNLTLGRFDEALSWNGEALERARSSGSDELPVLIERGNVLSNSGRFREAESVLEDALRIARERNDEAQTGGILLRFAFSRVLRNEAYGKAIVEIDEAIRIARLLRWKDDEALALSLRGLIHTKLGIDREADRMMSEAQALIAGSTNREYRAMIDFFAALHELQMKRASIDDVRRAIEVLSTVPGVQGESVANPRSRRRC